MSDTLPSPESDGLDTAMALDGYAFRRGDPMRLLLLQAGPLSDWDAFAESWDDMASRHLHG